ncbi:acetyl-CoA carboxylase biotin carboxylase subunit family protein [Photobacterium sp. 1_MG-2023]|uniref:ATP-grasp domain-containing protein n=1 Tax=Photobacterium sp. 1_MG-2023 TaxID=3062646 RepID=UPI0026E23D4C|nr:ATP-grasp domain-containing protein [Photobacterium sp. 1_MG-2023]MDO6704949.1 ATP-grasp domain-containing protein [Photobacterium sp. 1_MG-2023]
MKIFSINTAKRHNALSDNYYKSKDIIVCLKQNEYEMLDKHVIECAFEIVLFNAIDDLPEILEEKNIICNDDCIFSASEDFMYIAAKIRERFKLSGMKVDETSYFRDKCKMKERALSFGVNVPRYFNYEKGTDFATIASKVGTPFVLKPKDAAGAFGVYVIRDINDFEIVQRNTNLDIGYEYEEFIDGKLYHVDLLLKGGEVKFQAACEYSFPNLDFQFGKPCLSLILEENSRLHAQLTQFAIYSVKSLGLVNGPSHVEIFVKDTGELVFLEAACRTPGAIMVPIYQAQYDLNMIEAAIDIESGHDIEQYRKNEFFCMGGIFPAIKGRIEKINDVDLQSPHMLKVDCNVGDIYDGVSSVKNLSGSIIVKGESFSDVQSDFEVLKKFNLVE